MDSFFKKILNIGTTTNINKEHKTIKLLNSFSLFWIFAMIPIGIMDYFLVSYNEFIRNILFYGIDFVILCFVFFLQHKTFLILARVLFLLTFTLSILFFCIYDPGRLIEDFFILTPLAAIILIKNKWINISILFISFLFHILSLYFIDNYNNLNIDPTPILIIFMGAYLVLNYSKNLNEKHELALAQERDNVLSDKIILEKQEVQLRELNEFKSHFFINLSHEIRTPITLIKGYTSKIKLNKNDKNNQNLKIVHEQIQQIETILNNILDLSKLDANKLHLEKTKTELSPFLDKHFADFRAVFSKKNISFNINNTIEGIKINMDTNLVSKSINNILSNTLKFTPKNGTVSIDVHCKNDLTIAFTDNGIGIPSDDLHKIFNRFYQSKNHITKSQGSGIGLSFTKSILDAHGFSINVTSIPNVKTTFTIAIPKEHIIYPKLITIKSTKKEVLKPKIIEKNKNTILIVDDHQQMRNYLKSILTNYNVIQAENGKEALNILKNTSVDLLLTDYMMPIMNGEELVKEVKKMNLKIPVIIITAQSDSLAKLNILRIGIDGYINKPFIEEELLLLIKNSLITYRKIIVIDEILNTEDTKEICTDQFSENIKKIIDMNITKKDFGVQDIADYFYISKSTLNRKIKNNLGLTAQQLITQIKIEKARKIYLENPSLSQKEIANSVGMSNSVYLFKKLNEYYNNHIS